MATELHESISSVVTNFFTESRKKFENKLKKNNVDDVSTIMKYFDEVFAQQSQKNGSVQKPKPVQEKSQNSEGVKIILHYGTKNHAIIGPFGTDLKEFKDGHLKTIARYNKNLNCGPGWVFNFDKLEELEEKLKDDGISYTKEDAKSSKKPAPKKTKKDDSDSEKSEEEKPKPKPKPSATKPKPTKKKESSSESSESEESDSSSSESESEEEKPKSSKEGKTKTNPPAKPKPTKKDKPSSESSSESESDEEKPKPSKEEKPKPEKAKEVVVSKPEVPPKPSETSQNQIKLSKNSFGNYVDKNTGIVYLLGVNVGGVQKKALAIGIQDNETEKTGLDSVIPLDEPRIEICRKTKRTYLSKETFNLLDEQQKKILKRLVKEEEEESEDESDEE